MSKTLYIFDIDGTLTDSISTYIKAITQVFSDLGLKDIDTDYDNYLHHTDRYALAYNYERNMNKLITDELCYQVDELFARELQKYNPVTPIPGARETIQSLQNDKIPFAYATGAFPMATIIKMKDAQIPCNEAILATSLYNMTREGLVQEAISKAQTHYNYSRFDRIISVGDGIWDYKTAQNLKLDFIGIGLKNKEELLQAGCTHWMEDLTDFPKGI